MAFSYFPLLPPELRTEIFNATLREETQNRIVVLSHFAKENRIHPFADLLSPLLMANRESRAVAQQFFTCRLVVYKMLKSPESDRHLSSFQQQAEDFSRLNAAPLRLLQAFTSYVDASPRGRWALRLVPRNAEHHPRYRGILYLNLERDIVTTGYTWDSQHPVGNQWAPRDVWRRLPASSRGRRYITEAMREPTCHMVRRFLRVVTVSGARLPANRIRGMWVIQLSSCLMMMSKEWADRYWLARHFPHLTERLELLQRGGVPGEFLRDRVASRHRLLHWPGYVITPWRMSTVSPPSVPSGDDGDNETSDRARTREVEVYIQGDKLVQPGLWDHVRYWFYSIRRCMRGILPSMGT